MNTYKLYVDELGTSHPGTASVQPYYILMGCVIDERYQAQLKIHADQIKFKYWGRTDIVFHSADMARNEKDYAIFTGKPTLKQEFLVDLIKFLSGAKVVFTVCVIDKMAIVGKGWQETKIVEYTAKSIMGSFLAKVKSMEPSNGKMIFEISNGFKDRIYLETFNYLISPDFSHQDADYDFRDVRQTLTSINFVTKQNHDIETQISDILSYAAKCKVLSDIGSKTYVNGSYEADIIAVLENKLMKIPVSTGAAKRVYLNKINSFEVVS